MTLDRSDLQGNILRGYTHRHAGYLFVEVRDAGAGRRLLSELIDPVTTAREWETGNGPESTLNVALTAAGLEAIGVDSAVRATFPEDFRAGMRARAKRLGDVRANAPKRWEKGLRDLSAHLLLTVYGSEDDIRDEALGAWKERVEADPGLRCGYEQLADQLEDAREHFGFRDGFSQPAVEGSRRSARGEGVMRRFWRWRELRLGEFVLGHRDEDGVVPARGVPLLYNGTFMVWRKLHQDVALFRRWVRDEAGGDPDEEDWVRAKIVGRWPNGDSLVRTPDGHTPRGKRNRFRYSRDKEGLRCPVGAHVRRANPRDGLGWRTERTRRSRLLRRGMPYGAELPEGALEDDRQKRGLIFVCLNASIARQFELVQSHWLNDGDAFGLGSDRDFLLGRADPAGKMTVPGDPPRFFSPQQQFVRMRGGEYLFVPGMTALEALAAG